MGLIYLLAIFLMNKNHILNDRRRYAQILRNDAIYIRALHADTDFLAVLISRAKNTFKCFELKLGPLLENLQ